MNPLIVNPETARKFGLKDGGTSDALLRPTKADPLSGQGLHKENCVRLVKA